MEPYGSKLPPPFKENEVLTAEAFNAVKNYWVTDELPEDAPDTLEKDKIQDGDVVFVIGDSPVGDSGELPGLGGWAEITDVSGSPKRYAYPDPANPEWVAFEWTDTNNISQSVTVKGTGFVDGIIVSAGGAGYGGGSQGAGNAGGVLLGPFLHEESNSNGDPLSIIVGAPIANSGNSYPSGLGSYRILGGGYRGGLSGNGYQGVATGCGAGARGDGTASTPGLGVVSTHKDGNPITYAVGGASSNANRLWVPGEGGHKGASGDAFVTGQPGVVIVRVPAAYAEKVPSGSWVTRSNYFAVVENGVVTETYTEHHYGNGTTTPLPQTDLIPCDANVTEGYSYENGEFVAPPAPEIPAAQQEILDKINELQQELRSYDV